MVLPVYLTPRKALSPASVRLVLRGNSANRKVSMRKQQLFVHLPVSVSCFRILRKHCIKVDKNKTHFRLQKQKLKGSYSAKLLPFDNQAMRIGHLGYQILSKSCQSCRRYSMWILKCMRCHEGDCWSNLKCILPFGRNKSCKVPARHFSHGIAVHLQKHILRSFFV